MVRTATGAERVVLYKSSGEALAEGGTSEGDSWSPSGVRAHADKLARIHARQGELGIRGLITVSGAGNIVRGEKLHEQGIARGVEDFIGRLGTLANTFVISAALKERRVPHEVMIAPGITLGDVAVGDVPVYDHERAVEAFEAQRMILIGGGKGTDGNTTDAAVMFYAADYKAHEPDATVAVLKGTKVDGVFDGDPMRNQSARRYAHIAAQTMFERHAELGVVDAESLLLAMQHGLDMLVYHDAGHDISEVLAPDSGIGTIVHGTFHAPVYADEVV